MSVLFGPGEIAMTYRRASWKERARTGKAHIVTGRGRPPPPAWSNEAIDAYDASELVRPLPSMIAFNYQGRSHEVLKGVFDLHIPAWGLTISGCLWFCTKCGPNEWHEWVSLPKQRWIGPTGRVHYDPILTFHDERRFRASALTALYQCISRLGEAAEDTSEDEPPSATVTELSLVPTAAPPEPEPEPEAPAKAASGEPGDDVPF